MGEHSAVNRSVVGSSPTGGAHKACKFNVYGLYLFPRTTGRADKPAMKSRLDYVTNDDSIRYSLICQMIKETDGDYFKDVRFLDQELMHGFSLHFSGDLHG